MDPLLALLAAVAGYLAGSISFARIVARLAAPQVDLTQTEMAIPGTDQKMPFKAMSGTTVSMHLGPKMGMFTATLDMLKVALPTLAFRIGYPGTHYFLIAAFAGVIGHNWPVFHRFQGGKGLSAIYGGMFVIDWIGVFATGLGGMILGLVFIRNVVVSYLAGLWLMIPWLWFRTHDLGHLAYAVAVNVVFTAAMIPEIRAIRAYERQGIKADMARGMDMTPMGRMISKMSARLGLVKKPPEGRDGPV